MEELSLRKRFDNLYKCFDVCLNCVSDKRSFQTFCLAVSEMTVALDLTLRRLIGYFLMQLPTRSEEPEDMVWDEEISRLQDWSRTLKSHEFCEAHYPLIENMKYLIESINDIDYALNPEDRAEIYADYSERELQLYYDSGQWNNDQRALREKILQQPSNHHATFFAEQKNEWLARLKELAPYAVDIEKETIYHEALGRKLWGCRKNETEFRDVLKSVKSADYYGGRLGKELTYLDREYTEEELKQPEVKTNVNKQKAFDKGTFGYAKFTCYCSEFFNEGFDEKWVIDFWKALAESPIAGYIANRKDGVYKMHCQIVGELIDKGVFMKGKESKMAKIMYEKEKSMDLNISSLTRYIKFPFSKEKIKKGPRIKENQEISAWIQAYKPEENKESET